ncbi:hypothetical protein E4P39_13790 [Blastococcus sp. CT_GayMR19]|nr:hypothetical protein E4P39_13790 [Blastococcus sp. CT_GayMR19]
MPGRHLLPGRAAGLARRGRRLADLGRRAECGGDGDRRAVGVTGRIARGGARLARLRIAADGSRVPTSGGPEASPRRDGWAQRSSGTARGRGAVR